MRMRARRRLQQSAQRRRGRAQRGAICAPRQSSDFHATHCRCPFVDAATPAVECHGHIADAVSPSLISHADAHTYMTVTICAVHKPLFAINFARRHCRDVQREPLMPMLLSLRHYCHIPRPMPRFFY
jgi:hypothetical protein